MLSKKFLREGETVAASATSGEIIEAVNAAAVKPVTIFSFKDAFTTNLALWFDAATDFDGFRVNGAFKNAWEVGASSFLLAQVNGTAIEIVEVEAIVVVVARVWNFLEIGEMSVVGVFWEVWCGD